MLLKPINAHKCIRECYCTVHRLHVLATPVAIFSEVHYKGQRYAPSWR